MTSVIKYSIIILCLCGLFFGFGWFLNKYLTKPEIKIVKETKTVTKYIKPKVTTIEGLQECYQSPIEIDGVIQARKNILSIKAYDRCKQAEKDFYLKAGQNDGWKWGVGIGVGIVAGAGIYALIDNIGKL